MMVLGGGVFVRYLNHQGAAHINRISALIKRVTERLLAPFHHVRIQREVCNPEKGPQPTMLTP